MDSFGGDNQRNKVQLQFELLCLPFDIAYLRVHIERVSKYIFLLKI